MSLKHEENNLKRKLMYEKFILPSWEEFQTLKGSKWLCQINQSTNLPKNSIERVNISCTTRIYIYSRLWKIFKNYTRLNIFGFSCSEQIIWGTPFQLFSNLTSLHLRLRDLLVFCKAGFEAAPKISYLAVICQQCRIWRGLDGNQSKVQPAKIARIARIWRGRGGDPKRQEAKSRNSASRVHFLFLYPIEISHCGQKTKHQWQQHSTL